MAHLLNSKHRKRGFYYFLLLVFIFTGRATAQSGTKLYVPDTTEHAVFGYSVDISGNWAIVGAPGAHGRHGAAYLFHYENGTWERKSVNDDNELGPLLPVRESYGEVVSMGEQIIAISNQLGSDNGGELDIFYKSSESSDQWEGGFYKRPDGEGGKGFGTAISTNGTNLLVGRPEGASGGGEVYGYTLRQNNGQVSFPDTLLRTFECPDGLICEPINKEHFGSSIDLEGDIAAISSPVKQQGDSLYRGAVYMYEKMDGHWKQQQLIYPPEQDTTIADFGKQVAINDEYLIVSDPNNQERTDIISDYRMGGGAVYVYKRTPDGWTFDQKIVHSDVYASDDFGWSIDINDDNLLAIGHWDSDLDSTSSIHPVQTGKGLVHVYQKQDEEWRLSTTKQLTDTTGNKSFSESIGLSNNNNLIVGAPAETDTSENISGTAYIYDLGTLTDIRDVGSSTPEEFLLHQNYPNPFNPSTNIRFSLPQAEQVIITVYNTIGQRIKTLVNRHMNAGSHSVSFNAPGLPSGVYFYRLETADYTESKKMLLVK